MTRRKVPKANARRAVASREKPTLEELAADAKALFKGMKLDLETHRKNWATIYDTVEMALQLAEHDLPGADVATRAFLKDGDDLVDEISARWKEAAAYLEATAALIRLANAKLEISKERVKLKRQEGVT